MIMGPRDLPIGVAKNSFGKSTISFGMPSPRISYATSSVKLLQLWLNTSYVDMVNLWLMSCKSSMNISSGISVEPSWITFVG